MAPGRASLPAAERLRAAGVDPGAAAERLAGGDTSAVFRVGEHVVKVGGPDGALAAEAGGLAMLGRAGVRVPEIAHAAPDLLVLRYLAPGPPDPSALGAMLAHLHRPVDAQYGSDDDVFLGGIRLPGARSSDWSEILLEYRLRPLLRMAAPTLGPASSEALHRWLDTARVPVEGPCIVHGDLWAGNALDTQDGPALIDPCAQVGERALDLAMMRLFGGFGPEVWRAMAPIPARIEPAIDACTLVFLLAHVVIFGASYRSSTLALAARLGAV